MGANREEKSVSKEGERKKGLRWGGVIPNQSVKIKTPRTRRPYLKTVARLRKKKEKERSAWVSIVKPGWSTCAREKRCRKGPSKDKPYTSHGNHRKVHNQKIKLGVRRNEASEGRERCGCWCRSVRLPREREKELHGQQLRGGPTDDRVVCGAMTTIRVCDHWRGGKRLLKGQG